jgi:hypothetical protein
LKDVDATRAVGPCGRWVRAAGRGHVPPGRGAACRWSGAEMGRPAEPAREGQEVHRDLPLGVGVSVEGRTSVGGAGVLARYAAHRAEKRTRHAQGATNLQQRGNKISLLFAGIAGGLRVIYESANQARVASENGAQLVTSPGYLEPGLPVGVVVLVADRIRREGVRAGSWPAPAGSPARCLVPGARRGGSASTCGPIPSCEVWVGTPAHWADSDNERPQGPRGLRQSAKPEPVGWYPCMNVPGPEWPSGPTGNQAG